jgi:hypothetical protein
MPSDEQWFSVDLAELAHVVVLDDSPWLQPDQEGHGAAFLVEDLSQVGSAPWRIVMHHVPLYSASPNGHGSSLILRDRWGPLFTQFAVDLVVAGHEHDYERTSPQMGTTFVVTAGAGAPLVDAGKDVWTDTSASVHHYLVLEIDGWAIRGTAVDLEGAIIESSRSDARPLRCGGDDSRSSQTDRQSRPVNSGTSSALISTVWKPLVTKARSSARPSARLRK